MTITALPLIPLADITTTRTPDGTRRISWEMNVETADEILTLLAADALGNPESRVRHLIDPLHQAIANIVDRAALRSVGCEYLWPDAAPMPLTEPAVLGNDTGSLLSVLIPGQIEAVEAITLALAVAREAGADLDSTDPSLHADAHPARWLILNTCESPTHDFHPELAPLGERSPGAVLVTRVDFLHI